MEPREPRSTGGSLEDATATGPLDDPLEEALAGLTGSQLRAVASDARSLCIMAGAGSGKTRVLTARMARRIRDGDAAADHTVACTFTRKAARQLRDRLRRYGVPVSTRSSGGGVGPGVRAGTIHQLALTVLRRHALDSDRPMPAIVEDRYATLRRIADDPTVAATVDAEIAWAKAHGLSPAGYGDAASRSGRTALVSVDRVIEMFAAYEASLSRARRVDLDDIIVHATDLLRQDEAFAARTRWRYRHLSVDEFQDINPAQFAFVDAMLGDDKDLCVVGDPNQAIYSWNGADPTLLHRLGEIIDGLETVHLGENHRSTPQVVAAAAAVLGDTGVAAARSALGDGPMPVVTAFDDDITEAEGTASLLLERRNDGVRWSEQAVLARTHDQLAVVRSALDRAGIPFHAGPGPGRDGGVAEEVVELATFHRAKGLEWTSVCVIGIEDGYVPIIHAVTGEALAEERRLLYVAFTRASRDLHCSWARTRTLGSGRPVERRPSPWLDAVARTAVPGTGRIERAEGARRVAALRASLRS